MQILILVYQLKDQKTLGCPLWYYRSFPSLLQESCNFSNHSILIQPWSKERDNDNAELRVFFHCATLLPWKKNIPDVIKVTFFFHLVGQKWVTFSGIDRRVGPLLEANAYLTSYEEDSASVKKVKGEITLEAKNGVCHTEIYLYTNMSSKISPYREIPICSAPYYLGKCRP